MPGKAGAENGCAAGVHPDDEQPLALLGGRSEHRDEQAQQGHDSLRSRVTEPVQAPLDVVYHVVLLSVTENGLTHGPVSARVTRPGQTSDILPSASTR